ECFACSGEGTTDSAPLDQRPVHDRAGFRRATTDEQVEFFTFPEVFEKEIAKGYDPAWLAKLLVQRDWIMPDPQGKSTRAERLPTIGNKRVYRFRPSILATDEPIGA